MPRRRQPGERNYRCTSLLNCTVRPTRKLPERRADPTYGINTIDPVVFLASMNRCVSAASLSVNVLAIVILMISCLSAANSPSEANALRGRNRHHGKESSGYSRHEPPPAYSGHSGPENTPLSYEYAASWVTIAEETEVWRGPTPIHSDTHVDQPHGRIWRHFAHIPLYTLPRDRRVTTSGARPRQKTQRLPRHRALALTNAAAKWEMRVALWRTLTCCASFRSTAFAELVARFTASSKASRTGW